ncbi:NADPH-dependent F420 reductase [Streptomyces profundus]|uniref:NADPH-dependent F420 reductase n=1 Tax=Streptomyces profundus TaxID=2867410 RepID=UPI001D168418|nr:NAD(P)-binding domain-containing protein [Streptomyces sp. MA3_2.13]UED87042.1 NAD(P)-binding domain-containing protein [Streptomyces sp. MA3_2.13]
MADTESTRIGVLGTGHVGRAVADGWARAGHRVVFGSRQPAERTELAQPVVGWAEAVERSEVLVNATPGGDSLAMLTTIGAEALAGKVLIDIGVALTEDWDLGHLDVSLGQLIQREFPGTPVVKTLCTMDSTVMVAPEALPEPTTVFLSGDSAEAKRTVAGLLTDLGWDESSQLDLGGIATGRGQEHFALLFMGIAGATGGVGFNVRVVRPVAAG